MIEINLVPDVKLEFIRAQRQRMMVISASILVSIVAGGVVVLMALYAFGAQGVAKLLANNAIKSEFEKLQAVEDLPKTLTVQKQMRQLSELHSNKLMGSRLFEVRQSIIPKGKNAVKISRITIDTEAKKIAIEAEAENGYEALEVFKKTIAQTKFEYERDGQEQSDVDVAANISDTERRYGENTRGQRVLRFTLSFEYPAELFSPQSEKLTVIAPRNQNVTDSDRGTPKSLFENGEDD